MQENPETLIFEREGAVLWIRLNRPQAKNGIDQTMRDELQGAFLDADADPEIRCVVLTGSEGSFCSGGDLMPKGDASGAAKTSLGQMDYRRSVRPYQQLTRTYWEMATPVVAAVNGTTAGMGWMMALLADLVVAAEGARWTHVFSRRGMVPHAGDPFFLPHLLPFHKLNEAMLLSDAITSETLYEWNVLNRVVPADHLEETARELATRIAAGPTRTLGISKQLYRRSLTSTMETMFYEEADATALVTQTHDRVEGVQSLVERRPPDFIGN